MIDKMLNVPEVTTLERVLSFTQSRHEILANNIANIDTPGFKMRDLDEQAFRNDLRDMIEQRSAPGTKLGRPMSQIDYDQYLLFHDNNNRSIEKQMTSITKNSMLHNVAVELLRSRYRLLEQAVRLKL